MSTRSDDRNAPASWMSRPAPHVKGTFAGQTPPPPSAPGRRVPSDRELTATARGRAEGFVRGYLIGVAIGFALGFLSALLLMHFLGGRPQ